MKIYYVTGLYQCINASFFFNSHDQKLKGNKVYKYSNIQKFIKCDIVYIYNKHDQGLIIAPPALLHQRTSFVFVLKNDTLILYFIHI